MPELPEVQTIINNLLTSSLLNKKIVNVIFYKPKILKNSSPKDFSFFLINEKFINIERKGKYLIFKLTNKKILLIHLRMEGKLFYEKNSKDLNFKHLMITVEFANNHSLFYCDSRMFGTFTIYSECDYLKSKELSKIAIDPLDKNFNDKYLQLKLKKINRAIKTTLLDQTIVSGIGNIYVDEILFKSKIHPLTKAKDVTLKQCNLIVENAKEILIDSIKHKGTTIFSYKFDKNHTGEYQKKLLVHTRNKLPCFICKTPIEKIKINGRGTYFCSKCQKIVGKQKC